MSVPAVAQKRRFAVSRLAGGAAALYLLVGRWTPGRLNESVEESSVFLEPRLWIVIVLLLSALAARAWHAKHGRDASSARRAVVAPVVGLQTFLFAYLISTASWASEPRLAWAKAYEIGLVAAATYSLYLWLISANVERLYSVFWSSVLVLLVGMAALAVGRGPEEGRLAVLGGGPNVFGRNMGLLALIALHSWLHRPQKLWSGLLALGALMLLVLSGSRGAMFASAAGLVALLALARVPFRRIVFVCCFLPALAALLLRTSLGAAALDMFRFRILHLVFEASYLSGRDVIVAAALDLGARYPLTGAGLGTFKDLTGFAYPHNIVLEIFTECGLLGVGLLAATALGTLGVMLRYRIRPDPLSTAALVLILVQSQFSGDLYDARGIFLMLLLALTRPTPASDNTAA